MLEILHRIGSSIRNSRFLRDQSWLWDKIEPLWQKSFFWFSRQQGYSTRINGDVFKLVYEFGSRYDRHGKGEYEPVFYNAFVQRIKEGMIVFDIGSHIGIFSLGAAKRVGTKGKVYCFEPSPETIEILKQHISFNE